MAVEWRAYAGYDQQTMAAWVEEIVRELDALADVERAAPSFLHSAAPTVLVESRHGYQIRVIAVEGDPIFRLLRAFLGRGLRREASFLVVRADRRDNPHLRRAMAGLLARIDGAPPWNLQGHPQLARSPLIAWKTRREWLRWVQ